MKRHRGEILFVATHPAVDQKIDRGFIGVGFEPRQRCPNDFFGVAMEFEDEGREKTESMAAERAEEPVNWQGICFRQSDQLARVAPMPPQVAGLLASLTLVRLPKSFSLKAAKIRLDLRFEQLKEILPSFCTVNAKKSGAWWTHIIPSIRPSDFCPTSI
jgi:hypothetical protein